MEEFLRLCMECAFRRVTGSTRVNPGPAFLFSAHLVASSVGAATVTIRDGSDTGGEPKVELSSIAYSADPRIFVPPIYFEKGIYVDCGSNVVSVLVQFRQTGDIERLAETRSLRSYIPSWLGGTAKGRKNT